MAGPIFNRNETASNTLYWKIGDYYFEWKKLNINTTNQPIQGEVCVNGYWTNTRFADKVILVGEDPHNKAHWKVKESL